MPTIQKDQADSAFITVAVDGITVAEIELRGFEIVEEYEYGDGRPVEEHIGWNDITMVGSVLSEKGTRQWTEIVLYRDMPMFGIAERAFDDGPPTLTPDEFAAAMKRQPTRVLQAAE